MPGKNWTFCLAELIAGLLVAACDESKRGRALRHEKGTDLGPFENPLENEQLNELRQRATLQGGV